MQTELATPEVRTLTCVDMHEFQQLVAPLKMSRHMVQFFSERTDFPVKDSDVRWNLWKASRVPATHDVCYLVQDDQVIALWISKLRQGIRVSGGTYVERKHRRKGFASLLWSSAKEHTQGYSCTDYGYGFLSALAKRRTNVSFERS